jgi:hypothetical protein
MPKDVAWRNISDDAAERERKVGGVGGGKRARRGGMGKCAIQDLNLEPAN